MEVPAARNVKPITCNENIDEYDQIRCLRNFLDIRLDVLEIL